VKAKKIETTRNRRKWAYNIKICLREIGWSDMGQIDLALDTDQRSAVVKTGMNPSGFMKCGENTE
jgi:hypothetical protein